MAESHSAASSSSSSSSSSASSSSATPSLVLAGVMDEAALIDLAVQALGPGHQDPAAAPDAAADNAPPDAFMQLCDDLREQTRTQGDAIVALHDYSYDTVEAAAKEVGANVFRVGEQHACVRANFGEDDFTEVRVACVGNVDAGKSTMLAVLAHGELDDGRGKARQRVFRHKHEIETGRTSSVSNDLLGFDARGNITNKPGHDGSLDWADIARDSAKVIGFTDLAGHEKYLKTTVFGLTGQVPDYAMLVVGANAGMVGMAKEHLGLALALQVPVYVVVTKIDMCPPNVLKDTLKMLQMILRSRGCNKLPLMVNNMEDVVTCATNFESQRLCPIFQVSNVSGQGLEHVRMFLNLLRPRIPASQATAPAEVIIDDTFSVPGVGTVVAGAVVTGVVRTHDRLLLGPDSLGQYVECQVKSIQRKRAPVDAIHAGQTGSFALRKVKRSAIRRGMMLVAPEVKPAAIAEFEAEILILHHPSTIACKYQAMVHVGCVRQTASIVDMTKEHLRTGDKACVRFRFQRSPEFIKVGQRMVFREGRTKAVGTVTAVFPMERPLVELHPPPRVSKRARRRRIARELENDEPSAAAAAPAKAKAAPRPQHNQQQQQQQQQQQVQLVADPHHP